MLIYLFIFLLGLSVGSFLNVVIHRLETKEPIIKSRSRCPKCGTVLKWFDLIPLVSFIWRKGRCGYCNKKISWQYPLVELATGLLFLFVILNTSHLRGTGSVKNLSILLQDPSLTFRMTFHLIIVSLLIVIFVYDLKHYLIPDKIIYPAVGIAFLYSLFIIHNSLFNHFISAFLAGGFFLSFVLISKGRWMGLGDVKLAFLMGLVLGWPNILMALFLSFASGAIVGLGLIAFGKKKLKSEVPFGPFLVAGTIFILLYGSQLITENFIKLL